MVAINGLDPFHLRRGNLKALLKLGILTIVLSSGLGGCFLHSDIVEAPPKTASAELCGECHTLEYKEWKTSAHSKAWTSENFVKETDNYKVKKCLACHRAAPIYGAKEITVRPNHPKEGVTCVTCHLTPDQEIGGPHFVLPAHSVKMSDPFYLNAKLCGTCHESHYEQWKKTKTKLAGKKLETCQECHMQPVRRKLIVTGLMQYAHWEMDAKKHDFSALPKAGADQKPWFEAEVSIQSQKTKDLPISLTLRHRLPHAVPSGIFGFKAVDLIISLKQANGRVIEEQHRVFHAENKEYLEPLKDYKQTFIFSRQSLNKAEFVEVRLVRRQNRISLGKEIFLHQTRI